MSNFGQLGSLLENANAANSQAAESIARLEQRKEEEQQQKDTVKDAVARGGELFATGLIENSAQNLIKKGIKLGRDKLNKLGVNSEEIDNMINDFNENGTSGLLSGVIQRNGLKSKEAVENYLTDMKGKMEGAIPARPSANIDVDEFGLPRIKADLPPEVPLVNDQLTKTGSEFNPSRMLDPEFNQSKFKLKTEDGQVSIVNRETGNLATDSEVSGIDNSLLNKAKANYEEPIDPLESIANDPTGIKELKARFESYGLNNDATEKPLASDIFKFTRPIQRPKPSLPKPTEDISRFGVGDTENIPSSFASNNYLNDLKNSTDYGKNISRAFLGERADTNKLTQLGERLSDIKTRKANLDSNSLRSMYKEKLSNAPKRRIVNGEEDVDALEKNVQFKENAMDSIEKFQGIARTQPSSADLGIVKSQDELFPPPPTNEAEAAQAEQAEAAPTQQAAQEPKPVNEEDTYQFRSVSQEELPNLGSSQGSLSNVSRALTGDDLPSVPNNLRDTNLISNETPQGSAFSDFDSMANSSFGDVLKNASDTTQTTLGAVGDLANKGADIASAGVKTAASAGDSVAEAGAGALSTAGETDLALGGPEDPVGDVISAVVGVGAFLGSLFGDKPKASAPEPPPPQIRSTYQIGQDV